MKVAVLVLCLIAVLCEASPIDDDVSSKMRAAGAEIWEKIKEMLNRPLQRHPEAIDSHRVRYVTAQY